MFSILSVEWYTSWIRIYVGAILMYQQTACNTDLIVHANKAVVNWEVHTYHFKITASWASLLVSVFTLLLRTLQSQRPQGDLRV